MDKDNGDRSRTITILYVIYWTTPLLGYRCPWATVPAMQSGGHVSANAFSWLQHLWRTQHVSVIGCNYACETVLMRLLLHNSS